MSFAGTNFVELPLKFRIGKVVTQSRWESCNRFCGLRKNQLLKSEMEEGLNRGQLVNLYCVKGHRRIGIPFSGQSPSSSHGICLTCPASLPIVPFLPSSNLFSIYSVTSLLIILKLGPQAKDPGKTVRSTLTRLRSSPAPPSASLLILWLQWISVPFQPISLTSLILRESCVLSPVWISLHTLCPFILGGHHLIPWKAAICPCLSSHSVFPKVCLVVR